MPQADGQPPTEHIRRIPVAFATSDPEESFGITRLRYESKLSVPAALLPDILRIVAAHLPLVRSGAGAPAIATFYFDDPLGSHLRTAVAEVVSFRLRLREYPTGADRHEHWLEVKRNAGPASDKRRRRLAPEEVGLVLRDPVEAARRFVAIAPELGGGPLRPTLASRYHRETFAKEGCRITVDRSVSFFRPPAETEIPLAARLRTAVRVESEATLEIKRTGAEQEWMRALRSELTAQPESKFVRGSRALESA